jgi:hypothetical protein
MHVMSFGSLNSYILRIEYVHIGAYIFLSFFSFFLIYRSYKGCPLVLRKGVMQENLRSIFCQSIIARFIMLVLQLPTKESCGYQEWPLQKYTYNTSSLLLIKNTKSLLRLEKSPYNGWVHNLKACFKVCFESS